MRKIFSRLLVVAIGLGVAAARVTHAAEPPPQSGFRDRTGPGATPLPVPPYTTPRDLASPGSPAQPPVSAPGDDRPMLFDDIHIAGDATGAQARARKRPGRPSGQAEGLRIRLRPGEVMGAAWVRRQFVSNRLIGAPTTADHIASLVLLINEAFIQNGYINTGLLLERQDWPGAGAVLNLKLVKGRFAPLRTRGPNAGIVWARGGARGLRRSYVRNRMPSVDRTPLNTIDVEHDFRLLADDPAIRTINARVSPGGQPGVANLTVTVAPQPRLDVYATVANSRSPSVGGIRYGGGATFRNAVFSGDLLSLDGGETSGLADAVVAYSTPFFSPSTFVDFRGVADQAAVVDQAVRSLAIRSEENSIEAGVSERLINDPLSPMPDGAGWTPAQSLAVGIRLASRHTYSSLLGSPFSFSPGAFNGVAIVNVVRGTADYVLRGERQVLAVSATATYGISGTGPDLPGVVTPDPHFKAILLEANYARRLTLGWLEFRARLTAQQATSPLYSSEQLAAGGQDTVRGYRENLLLADGGVIGSLELACPVSVEHPACDARTDSWKAVRLSVFTDGAYLRNHAGPQPTPDALASVGVGVTWTPSNLLFARFTYGGALISAAQSGPKDIQDEGIGFMVTVHPLAGLSWFK